MPEQARTPVEVLSGGERGRLMLARALAKPSNLLVLDEPTNDLDLETLDVLEEMLGDYAGTVLLISHDRDFLDRVVTSVMRRTATGSGSNMPAATAICWRSAARNLRREAPKSVPIAKDVREARPQPTPAAPKRRLNFNEKHALETLPKAMAALQETIARNQARLADPSLYVRDRKAFDEISAALADAQAKLHAAEEKWLALEILREELENGSTARRHHRCRSSQASTPRPAAAPVANEACSR